MTPEHYRSIGYQVFPCAGKRPARCPTWPNDQPFRDGDNIALVVPEGALVLDLDRKPGEDGVKALAEIMPQGWQHTGPRAVTGGGGLHLWFRVSPFMGLGNATGTLPKAIHVRGGGKGYVIAPPSYHPETGVMYEWTTPLAPVAELMELPQWLISHLIAEPKVPQAQKSFQPDRDLSPYLQAALEQEQRNVAEAPDGQGNNTINIAAFNLGTLAAHGLTYNEAQYAIAQALSGWSWRSPRDEQAAWRTFDSGWRAGENTPRAIPDDRATRSRPHGQRAPSAVADGHPNAPAPDGAQLRDHLNSNDFNDDDPNRPDPVITIRISTDERQVNDQAIDALAKAGYEDMYQRAGSLCRVVRVASQPDQDAALRLPEGAPMIRQMSRATLRERMADSADWRRHDKKADGWVPAHPPQWSVMAVSDRGEYPGVPPLRGIASYPMIRPDGTISSSPGYDPGTGYYLGELPADLSLKNNPTQQDAAQAATALLELVADFPFRTDTDRAAWLAYLLTPLARAVINGPTPLFLVEANVRGSGKTLLADVAGLSLAGRPLPAQTYPTNDEELEKVLVGVARMGLPVLCFDNVRGNIGGACLDKWLTSCCPTGRVLGTNDMPQFDWTTVLVATANNASVSGDTDRRSIYVCLQTEHERPELRSGFQIPDLPAYLVEHRGEILSNALTILQAHHGAGLPSGGRPKGTFEAWCSRVRDAVMFAGLPDCERAPDDDARPVDMETDELAALLAALDEHFAGADFTVSSILDAAFPASGIVPGTAKDLRDVLASMTPRDRPSRQLLGKRLARYRNRWLNGIVLNSVMDKNRKIQVWQLRTRDFAGSAGSVRVLSPAIDETRISKTDPALGAELPGTTRTTRKGDLEF